MSAAEKLLARMRNTAFGWGADDLARLYTGYGFIAREGARHTVYIHARFPQLRATVARHTSLATGYVTTAIKLIDDLQVLEAQELEAQEEENGEAQP